MSEITPSLTQTDWKISGDSLITWVSDMEFFDISPSLTQDDLWFLHYNYTGRANTTFLGVYGRIEDAQGAAKNWLGDIDDE
jgi:hypothetical protein